jgi:hypothetical protein
LPESACFRASPMAALESPLGVTLALACIPMLPRRALACVTRKEARTEGQESQITEMPAVT